MCILQLLEADLRSTTEARPRLFARPLPLAALVVLLFNDHVLKGSGVAPAAFTGKASDFAGLFFFPVLLSSIALRVLDAHDAHDALDCSRGLRRASATCVTAIGAVVTAAVFAAIKTMPAANAVACAVFGRTALDPTDLVALPACALSVVYVARTKVRGPVPRDGRVLERLALVLASLGSMATSPPYHPQVAPPEPLVPSPRVIVTVSGDRPLGDVDTVFATLTAREDCVVELGARVRVHTSGDERFATDSEIVRVELSRGQSRDVIFHVRLPLSTTCETPRSFEVRDRDRDRDRGPRGEVLIARGSLRCVTVMPLAVPESP